MIRPLKSTTTNGANMGRKSRGKRRTGRGTHTDNRKILLQYGTRLCFWCGCALNEKTLRADHLMALSLGGTNKLRNLVPSCNTCNTDRSQWQDTICKLFRVPTMISRGVERRYVAQAEDRYINKLGCSFIDRHMVGRYIWRNTRLCR